LINNVLPTLPYIHNTDTALTSFIHSYKYFMNNYVPKLFHTLKNKKLIEIVSKNKLSNKIRKQNYEILLLRKLLDNNNILYYNEKQINTNIEANNDEFMLILSDTLLLQQVNDVSCIALGKMINKINYVL